MASMGDLMGKLKQMWNTPDDEYDYEDEKVETKRSAAVPEEEESYYDEPAPVKESPRIPFIGNQSTKVASINNTTKLQVVMFTPDRFSDETRKIADELMKRNTIVLNLENTTKENSRRIIDFMSGAAYASRGKIKRVATSTFLVIPNGVDVTGDDIMGQLENNGIYL